jgi:competence protein ComEC
VKRWACLFFALVGAVLGVWLAYSFREPLFAFLLLLSLFFLLLSFKRGCLILLTFLLSLGLGATLEALPHAEKAGYGTYSGFVIETKNNYFLLQSGWARYYVYEEAGEREVGDKLLVRGKAERYVSTTYEGRFDFGEYLEKKGVLYSLYPQNIETLFARPLRLRHKEKSFLSSFDHNAGSLLDSLLFNKRDYNEKIIALSSSLGALYLLSASGLLFGFVLKGLEKLLFYKLTDRKSQGFTLLFGTFFLPFGWGKIGFFRVYLSRLTKFLFGAKKDECPSAVALSSLSGLLFLLIDFRFALESGFLLGYGCSLFMSFSSAYLNDSAGIKKKLKGTGLLYAFLFPLFASHNGIHLLAPFYTVLLLPFVVPFLLCGWLSFFSIPFTRFLNGYAAFLLQFLEGIEKVDLIVPLGPLNVLLFAFYYAFLVGFLYLEEAGYPRQGKGGALLFALALALNVVPFGNALVSRVSFLNVGQGDAILIQEGYTNVMIDTGGNTNFDIAKEVDIPYLYSQRVYHLDALIASHHDADHIGGKDSLMKNFKVKRFIDTASSFPLTIGDMTFTNYNTFGGDEENEDSLVLSLHFMETDFLFTGDAPESIEKKIVEMSPSLRADVLKVGHHGSASSSCQEFLSLLQPKVGIISVGARNKYGHPSKEALLRLQKAKIVVRRTDLEGTIIYKSWRGRPPKIP